MQTCYMLHKINRTHCLHYFSPWFEEIKANELTQQTRLGCVKLSIQQFNSNSVSFFSTETPSL